MIYLGFAEAEKSLIVERYIAEHNIRNTVVISPAKFPLEFDWTDNVEWSDTIEYVTFYRLLQEIHTDTLVVLSEPLRTQNRYELTYNCIRAFLNQTPHQIIFQYLPQIDTRDDFMILVDFDTRSRWKRRKWDINLILDNCQVQVRPLPIEFNRIAVPTSEFTKKKYRAEKARRFEKLGARDPHTIPRNLYLLGGKDKLAHIDATGTPQLSLFSSSGNRQYIARNQRLSRDNITTYANADETAVPYTIVEFPHRFIEFTDFMKRTGQTRFDVLTTDLKVDDWYFTRYTNWLERINETYASFSE
jgi:hypothetical protein